MESPSEIQTQLPLTEATYFILLSLAPGPRHGYAIMKDVHSLSHGHVTLSTGTLYTASNACWMRAGSVAWMRPMPLPTGASAKITGSPNWARMSFTLKSSV